MDRDKKNDLPGNSGGSGRRARRGTPSFLNPSGTDERFLGVNNNNERNENRRESRLAEEPDLLDWIDGQGSGVRTVRFNDHCEYLESPPGSSDQENERDVEMFGEPPNTVADVEVTLHPAFGYATCFGYGYFLQSTCTSYISAQVQGNAGVAVTLNNMHSNAMPMMSVNDMISVSVHTGHGGDDVGIHVPVPVPAGFGAMCNANCDGNRMVNPTNNEALLSYINTTSLAYQCCNSDILRQVFSLRDRHVFQILGANDYSRTISQICNSPDLAEALIYHIDCVKALLSRNLKLAYNRQIAVVNAVMRLVSVAFVAHEEWPIPVMRTVTYDLTIICDRVTTAPCRGRPYISFDWIRNSVTCILHPPQCQCHVNQKMAKLSSGRVESKKKNAPA